MGTITIKSPLITPPKIEITRGFQMLQCDHTVNGANVLKRIEILSQLHSRCATNSISNMSQQGMKYIIYIIPPNRLITLYTNYNTYLNSLHRRSYHFNSPSHCY